MNMFCVSVAIKSIFSPFVLLLFFQLSWLLSRDTSNGSAIMMFSQQPVNHRFCVVCFLFTLYSAACSQPYDIIFHF